MTHDYDAIAERETATERSLTDTAAVDEPYRPTSEVAALLFVAARLRVTADAMESKAHRMILDGVKR